MTETGIPRLDALPRVRMAHLPTGIEEMGNLRRALFPDGDGPRLLVKRDDNTGIAMGGNKVRQLEYYLGDALEKGADTILITSAVQSNYMRTCAAMSARLGLECHLQMEERVPKNDPLYRTNGNVLLDRITGAILHSYADGEDEAGADRSVEDLADRLRADGRKPYVIHLSPTHPPIGAVGYVDAARELLGQLEERGETVDRIYVGSGSAATHTGLLWGLRAFGSTIPVTGVCVRRPAAQQGPRVRGNLDKLSALLNHAPEFSEDDVVVTDVSLGPGYGRVTDPIREAISLAGAREGLFVDPVYTGKVLAGMIAELRGGVVRAGETALFIHTGGQPSLFAYGESVLTDAG
ncbi:MAG: D-cysteine desulfhydrase family protein [Thalassobaculaceae bacterium]|nr:D-cysteine desulfhydrase family protein [Thalassobaculaceae bacterium]